MPTSEAGTPKLSEDTPGANPSGVSGAAEATFFDKDAASHSHDMRKLDLGIIGRIIGDSQQTPVHIACVCIAAGFLLCLISVFITYKSDSASVEYWHSFTDRTLAFVASALAFVFGRTTSK